MDGRKIGTGLVGDDVGKTRFLSAGMVVEVVSHDLVDVLGKIGSTLICYILFSFILSLTLYTG